MVGTIALESKAQGLKIFLSNFASFGFIESEEVCHFVAEGVTRGDSTLFHCFFKCPLFNCVKEIVESCRYFGMSDLALQTNSCYCPELILHRQVGNNYSLILCNYIIG